MTIFNMQNIMEDHTHFKSRGSGMTETAGKILNTANRPQKNNNRPRKNTNRPHLSAAILCSPPVPRNLSLFSSAGKYSGNIDPLGGSGHSSDAIHHSYIVGGRSPKAA
jgi:hypothetical protein